MATNTISILTPPSRSHGPFATEGEDGSAGWDDKSMSMRPTLGRRHSSMASIALIDRMVSDEKLDTERFGVSEVREGFFDAFFLKPFAISATSEDQEYARTTLPQAFDKGSPLSPKYFFSRQAHERRSLAIRVTRTRAGIRLLKSCVAFLTAYILCLVPAVRDHLGRYSYIMAVSVIVNHPARTVGSQLDGAIFTIMGTAAGLGWGAIGLLLSTSTIAASAGFGGVLATFLVLFMGVIAWIRSTLVRFHQANICAGIAITFATLAETQSRSIAWSKLSLYLIPWLYGQAIALAVCCLIFPDAGARPLSTTLHKFFAVARDALVIPKPRDVRLRRTLAKMYVELSVAYRDLRIDLSITRFRPDDIGDLRNLMQAVIRAILSMDTETFMFDEREENQDTEIAVRSRSTSDPMATENAVSKVARLLARPTREILDCLFEGLGRCDAAIMDLSGYRKHLGPPPETSSDLSSIQIRLKDALGAFDLMEYDLLNSGSLPDFSVDDADIIPLFLFGRHVRETAAAIQALITKIEAMQGAPKWPRVYLPSYPFRQAIHRTNRQVRHDRGGITAASYHTTFADIAKLLDKIKSRDYRPPPRTRPSTPEPGEELDREARTQAQYPTMDAEAVREEASTTKTSKRYKAWKVLHRMEGFESRYAFKVCLVTSLLSVPSYLNGTEWWDEYEAWWVVSMSWIMIHPRVGGNVQDLMTRAFAALLGAVWAGAGQSAGGGSPYVLVVFAVIYVVPMLYRFTQSSHPVSIFPTLSRTS
jgi:Fusaric acid resistance protein-like/Putative ER transporter, 6TM, N-terminal